MKAAFSSFAFFSKEYKQEILFWKLTRMWCLAFVLPTYLFQLYLAYITAQNTDWKNYASI